MKKILLMLLALSLALSPAAMSEESEAYAVYATMKSHMLRVFVSPAWEELAVDGQTIAYDTDEHEDSARLTFYYMQSNPATPLFSVVLRLSDIVYAPYEGYAPAWTDAKGDWTIDMYILAEKNGSAYDVVLDSLTNPEQFISFTPPDQIWQFTCLTPDGETLNADELLTGNVTMLNVWGTYCPPCIQELPYLGELSREYADRGLRIVGLVSDVYEQGNTEYARRLISETGADYTHVLNNDGFMGSVMTSVSYLPTTVFLNSSGVEIARYVGSYEKADWASIIEGILAQ